MPFQQMEIWHTNYSVKAMLIVKQHAHRIKMFFFKMNSFLLSVQLIASLKALFAVYIDVKVTPRS